MSTRCVVTFKDDVGEFSVFKHHDGYPDGLLPVIELAKKYAWPLPRFEADEFAAAFVVAAKETIDWDSGGVRLTSGPEAHGDLEYVYIVTCKNGKLQVQYKEYEEKYVTKKVWI